MAIVVNNTPQDYSSAHGDLVYTVYESVKANTPGTYAGYKYVCDVYIAGVLVTSLKAYPNPINKRGIFNVGMIVRNYVNALFNPSSNAIKAQEFPNYFAAVQCKFGEEYGGTTYPALTNDSSRNFYNHYNNRLVGGYTVLPNYLNLLASNRAYATSVQLNGGQVFIPYFPTTTGVVTLNIKSYDSTGTQTASIGPTFTPSTAYYLQQLNVSPIAINTYSPGTVTTNTSYYTIAIGSAAPSYKFNVNCEARYTPYTLHFLNQYGGYDSFDFPKVSKKAIDITKKDFTQLGYMVDASGVMSYYNGTVLNDNKIVYYGDAVETKTLNSDFVTQDTYTWLADLVKSPQIYLEQSGYFIPITITDTKYEYKTRAVDRLFNLTVNIQFGDDQNVQYR